MDITIALKETTYVKGHERLATNFLTRLIYKIVKRVGNPTPDDLLFFWSTWPNPSCSGAAIWGLFFRMKPKD